MADVQGVLYCCKRKKRLSRFAVKNEPTTRYRETALILSMLSMPLTANGSPRAYGEVRFWQNRHGWVVGSPAGSIKYGYLMPHIQHEHAPTTFFKSVSCSENGHIRTVFDTIPHHRVHTRFLTKVSVLSETPHRFSPYLLACGVL